jgi:hypothetical protein
VIFNLQATLWRLLMRRCRQQRHSKITAHPLHADLTTFLG